MFNTERLKTKPSTNNVSDSNLVIKANVTFSKQQKNAIFHGLSTIYNFLCVAQFTVFKMSSDSEFILKSTSLHSVHCTHIESHLIFMYISFLRFALLLSSCILLSQKNHFYHLYCPKKNF